MTYVTCRPLALPDIPTIVTLDKRCFGGLWSPQAYQRECESPNSDLIVLEITDEPAGPSFIIGVGCLWAILEEAHITLLGIDPLHQRQGLGEWLLTNLLIAASDRRLTHATLEVRQSNQRAHALYKKFGFQIAGERRRYYSDGENAFILWRSGLQALEFAAMLQDHRATLDKKLSSRGYRAVCLPITAVES